MSAIMRELLLKPGKGSGGKTEYLLLVLCLLCLFRELSAEESCVYFWHRERNSETDRVLAAYSTWKIYALRGEFRHNESDTLLRMPSSVHTVPVFRFDARIWRKAGFAEKLAGILRKEPSAEIQIDCDVPESKLAEYAVFLEHLHRMIPGRILSVTLLPCHLRHRAELEKLFRNVSSYVLQLHALEKPGNLPAEYRLFDPDAADRAMKTAVAMQKEFKMALPAYAYRLHYAEKTGKFLRLSAENMPARKSGEVIRIAAPDWKALLEFRKRYADIPVIWFRLPMPGDRLCLEMANLKRLEAGTLPLETIETSIRRSGTRTEIFWTNHGVLEEKIYTQVLGGGSGEAFFFHGVRPGKPTIPGCVPETIRGPVPPPGQTLKTGEIDQWIQTDSKHSL